MRSQLGALSGRLCAGWAALDLGCPALLLEYVRQRLVESKTVQPGAPKGLPNAPLCWTGTTPTPQPAGCRCVFDCSLDLTSATGGSKLPCGCTCTSQPCQSNSAGVSNLVCVSAPNSAATYKLASHVCVCKLLHHCRERSWQCSVQLSPASNCMQVKSAPARLRRRCGEHSLRLLWWS